MLAIIGGTGIYNLDGMELVKSHEVDTPFGSPSAEIKEGQFAGKRIFFLPRHGNAHQLLPHEVNYRANIWALKKLGVDQVIGISAVGSLQEEIKPGDFTIPDQYFDFIKGPREKTFFGNGLAAHVSTAEPTCPNLAEALVTAAKEKSITIHTNKTYACVDGPRLGTRAESFFLRGPAGCDIVGMTNVPEVFLAREAQISYCTLCIATDYDCWQDDPSLHVSVEQVISRYGESLNKAKEVLVKFLENDTPECSAASRHALSSAVLTPEVAQTEEHKALLSVLAE